MTKERRHHLLGFSTTFAIFYSMKQSRACHIQGMGISPSLDKRVGGRRGDIAEQQGSI